MSNNSDPVITVLLFLLFVLTLVFIRTILWLVEFPEHNCSEHDLHDFCEHDRPIEKEIELC